MKIKRFVGTDMRQVLRQVRLDQGPDAVILSNCRIAGGIEVIAAVDYDEALMHQALGPKPAASSADNVDDSREGSELNQCKDITRNQSAGHGVPSYAAITDVEVPAIDALPATGSNPALDDVRSELSSLRGLLETQLAGLVWKNNAQRSPRRAHVLRNLARIGLAPDVVNVIASRPETVDNVTALWRQPLSTLAQNLPVVSGPLLTDSGIVALVGPTGVGKTTTIAKLAARHVMQHGADDIALVCADAYRIGAREHLEAFGNIIGVKVHAASDSAELKRLLILLQAKKLVLVDTEGLSQRDKDLPRRLAEWRANEKRVRVFLTLSAASQEAGLDETVRQFSSISLAGAVITKIDEAAQLGCVISALIRHDLPVAWLSDGQRIPDDLHPAEKKKLWLVNKAVEYIDRSEPSLDERTMAESYRHVSMANA
ncbi:MAG: flagellar biosynthesis protein FlhF [Woeseia sp.]